MAAAPHRPPVRPLSKPGGRLATWSAKLLVASVRAAPRGLLNALVSFGAAVAWALRLRRRVALDNLRLALPELSEPERRRIARGVYRNMARAALDGLRGPDLSREALDQTVVVEDWGSLKQVIDAGTGVLVASAHFGSWELLAEVFARRGFRVNAVVRPLEGSFNAELMRSRQESGVRLTAARGALGAMIKAVRGGDSVVMLLDQSIAAKHGVFVPFFGRPASTSPALAMAAIRTGVPVYVVLAAREGERLRMFVEGPVPVPETGTTDARIFTVTAAVTAILERYIRRYPDQWLWLHRRWKERPPAG